MHSGEVPETIPAFAFALTASIFDEETGLLQPVLTVYLIIVDPADKAVINPAAFTVATAVLLLLHNPPASPLLV